MAAQVVLSNKQSTQPRPYGFWTVTLSPRNRTANSVVIDCNISCSLQYSDSRTGFRVTCGIYLGGQWHEAEINPSGNNWSGTSPRSVNMTITVSGLSVTQTTISGIYVHAAAADGEGPGLSDTACSNLVIDMYGGVGHQNVNGTWKTVLPWVKVSGTWRQAIPWVNVGGTWKIGI